MKIAIVGCGISGANVLKNIIEHKNFDNNLYIDIYEKRSELGVGLAYEEDDMHKVLNTPVAHMNVNLEDRNEFRNWLIENYVELPTIEGKIPRPITGQYIQASI
ncbi:FAD/NAD(P)-binding protein [Anaerococcus sp. ENR0831]|uniref:FAD/NAD(P)-binding protein n=1 Tax=Anaerococcus martiniensis TaxID=3115615 RepID=A0ABW9M833_9FIRM